MDCLIITMITINMSSLVLTYTTRLNKTIGAHADIFHFYVDNMQQFDNHLSHKNNTVLC